MRQPNRFPDNQLQCLLGIKCGMDDVANLVKQVQSFVARFESSQFVAHAKNLNLNFLQRGPAAAPKGKAMKTTTRQVQGAAKRPCNWVSINARVGPSIWGCSAL